jgi:hypothetical protein
MEEEKVEDTAVETTAMTDLDSQPLNDLGVSVMDQDQLERNVAAQVGSTRLGWDLTLGGCCHVEAGRRARSKTTREGARQERV